MTPDAVYTHGHHESVLRSHTWRTADNSAAYLLPYIQPGLDVLDVGCGPGTITVDLARRVERGVVIGIDRSDDVIEQALMTDHPENVRFETGDVYHLGYPDNCFDVVHAHQLLQHLSDPIAALREMRRVCRPGGIVAARDGDYASFAWAPLDDRLDEWLSIYRAVARSNGGEPDAGRHLLGWAHRTGFDDVRASASVWCFSRLEDRDWWGSLWADRMQLSAVADQAVTAGLATREKLDDIAEAFRSWSTHPDGWFAVLHGEILAIK